MKKQKITVTATVVSEHEQVKTKEANQNILILKKEFAIVSDTKEMLNDHKQSQVLNSESKVNLIQEQGPFILKKEFEVIENKLSKESNIFNLKKGTSKLLEVRKVSKSLGEKPILKNISLTLQPGKIVGLLGPNGSGKTTLFNLIIGKIFPDQGSILFNNEPINNLPIHLRSLKGISLLEQHKGLFGNMTAEDNLYAILELHIKDKEKIYERIDALLAYFDLAYLKNTKANLLSGGEYKKISILQRICNPNISTLLLDEPCAALDPLSINSLKEFILELKKIGLSILITDHNYWAIENILDKAYLIKDGQILVEGTTDKISNDKNAIKYYLGGNFRL
ncbi:MAG: ATP-binding cassette domain-containing protein [Proteobacteria bacterium]|nr:ATP-binding cassette domain-containing protein [Pseudomonadota bacterium]